ncbi:MAG: hypothetical protein CVV21_08980 [Candidatus Goldiibacteriota bacterium HGW-Goldbacteria-1]|jgi:predicted nucleotidyltransferase|nr:MAG: hypothetical protein CVV21_08980 [Candidatus Goldiibacteriota bacterium HGW-Goldbacteria-1]
MDLNTMPYELINSRVKLKLFSLIMGQKTEITAGELARQAELPVMTVSRILNNYCAMNAMHHRRAGNVNFFRINKDSYAIKMLMRVYSAFENIKNPVEYMKDIFKEKLPAKLIEKAYVYGSVASEKSKPESDIDLFVVANSKKDLQKLENVLNDLETYISRSFGNTLVTYMITPDEYKMKKNLGVIKEAEKGIKII